MLCVPGVDVSDTTKLPKVPAAGKQKLSHTSFKADG